MKVTLQDIKDAQQTVKNLIIHTPCDISSSCTKLMGADIYLKLENNQRTGSFKMRGAANKIASLTEAEKAKGVIACSAGNHAQGVALSASLNNVKSVIVMPETAPLTKIEATQNYGAQVILKGQSFDEAKEYAYQLAKEKSYVFVHPYEDEKVIAGQGTIGLEVFEQIPQLDQIIVPIGGGGLISGIAIALKSLNPKIKVIGVQTQVVDTMFQLFKNHQYTEPNYSVATIADGIAIKAPSKEMYSDFISKYVDDIVTVSEGEIAEAIVFLLERAKTVAEGAGAAALAAVLSGKVKLLKKNCVMVCGGNIDLNIVSQVIQRGQIQRGRLSEMSVIVPDIPGSLSQLTKILAEHKANILEVHHDRVKSGLNLKETKIDFVIETTSLEHIEKIRQALKNWGAKVQ
ncbi:threonine ammonia-lyase [bacterium]|nr:threonine ammonia-lyase [bacterium]